MSIVIFMGNFFITMKNTFIPFSLISPNKATLLAVFVLTKIELGKFVNKSLTAF